jgi:hypothetical protein
MAGNNKGGRPPIYKDADELASKIDEYFQYVKGEYVDEETINPLTFEPEFLKRWIREPERITVTGLALFLGFESRQSLQDYKKKPKFSYPIKRALTKVEQQYENYLFERNSTGAIFALKNFGWTDKSQVDVDHTSKGQSMTPVINIINPNG